MSTPHINQPHHYQPASLEKRRTGIEELGRAENTLIHIQRWNHHIFNPSTPHVKPYSIWGQHIFRVDTLTGENLWNPGRSQTAAQATWFHKTRREMSHQHTFRWCLRSTNHFNHPLCSGFSALCFGGWQGQTQNSSVGRNVLQLQNQCQVNDTKKQKQIRQQKQIKNKNVRQIARTH